MEQGDACQGGKNAIQHDYGVEGAKREDTKQLEDYCNKQGVHGGEPGRRTGRLAEEAAISVTTGKGRGNIAVFVLEWNGGEDFCGDHARFVEEPGGTQEERDKSDEPGRPEQGDQSLAHRREEDTAKGKNSENATGARNRCPLVVSFGRDFSIFYDGNKTRINDLLT